MSLIRLGLILPWILFAQPLDAQQLEIYHYAYFREVYPILS